MPVQDKVANFCGLDIVFEPTEYLPKLKSKVIFCFDSIEVSNIKKVLKLCGDIFFQNDEIVLYLSDIGYIDRDQIFHLKPKSNSVKELLEVLGKINTLEDFVNKSLSDPDLWVNYKEFYI